MNEELQWFSDSLGLFGNRDKDKSCFRLFITLLKSLHSAEGLSSDQLADKVGLSRGTVVHHLHRLRNSGLVIHRQNKYLLKVDNLSSLISEIESDLLDTMTDLRKVAEDIDKRLEL